MAESQIVSRTPEAPAIDSLALFPAPVLGFGHQFHVAVGEDRYSVVSMCPFRQPVACDLKYIGNASSGRDVGVGDLCIGFIPTLSRVAARLVPPAVPP